MRNLSFEYLSMLLFSICFLASCKKEIEKSENNNSELGPKILMVKHILESSQEILFKAAYINEDISTLKRIEDNDSTDIVFSSIQIDAKNFHIKSKFPSESPYSAEWFLTNFRLDTLKTFSSGSFIGRDFKLTSFYHYDGFLNLDSVAIIDDEDRNYSLENGFSVIKDFIYNEDNSIQQFKQYFFYPAIGEFVINETCNIYYQTEIQDPKTVNTFVFNQINLRNATFLLGWEPNIYTLYSYFNRKAFKGFQSDKLISKIEIERNGFIEEEFVITYEKDNLGRISIMHVYSNDILISTDTFYY